MFLVRPTTVGGAAAVLPPVEKMDDSISLQAISLLISRRRS